ncbi:MAG: leucine-rich repeat protein, partial [Clostridia bacterium]|nr:leucine-rich repeat protein [Clostridia bacterium]
FRIKQKLDAGTRYFFEVRFNSSLQAGQIQVMLMQEAFECTLENGVLTISGDGPMPYPVPWYTEHSSIMKVVIEDGLTSICRYAFFDCSNLTSVTIPESMTSIGDSAFANCSSLSSVTIPKSVTHIGDNAFNNCRALTDVVIPGNVMSIGNSAFVNCWSLTTVSFENGVTSIGNDAFYNCKSLKSVTIPESITSIGSAAFSNCALLTTVIGPFDVPMKEYYYGGYCGLMKVSLPSSIEKVGVLAFEGSGLHQLVPPDFRLPERYDGNEVFIEPEAFAGIGASYVFIPYSVSQIPSRAFAGCKNLHFVLIECYSCIIADDAFEGCQDLTIISDSDLAEHFAEEHGYQFIPYLPNG